MKNNHLQSRLQLLVSRKLQPLEKLSAQIEAIKAKFENLETTGIQTPQQPSTNRKKDKGN